MRVIIAGGRNYSLTDEDFAKLDALHKEIVITVVVSGCAIGADLGGQIWAACNDIAIHRLPAEWDKLGRKAGPIRNSAMAEVADAVVLFKGNRGTKDMFDKAKAKGLKIYDWRK